MKIIKKFKQTPMLAVLCFVLVFFFPTAFVCPASNKQNTFVTTIGIDKTEEGIDLSLVYFLPLANQSFVESYETITIAGKNLAESFEQAGKVLGNNIVISHVDEVVLSQDMLQEDLLNTLDYIARNYSLTNSIQIVVSNILAKDLLPKLASLASSKSTSLKDLMAYKGKNIKPLSTTIESIYSGYNSTSQSFLLSCINVNQDGQGLKLAEESKSQEASSTADTSSSSSSDEEEGLYLVNDGSCIAIKKDSVVAKLDSADMTNLNFLKSKQNFGTITLKNVNVSGFKDATISVDIAKQSQKYETYFQNGVPHFVCNLKLFCKFLSAKEEEPNIAKNKKISISNPLAELISAEVMARASDIVAKLKEQNLDLFDVYKTFYNQSRKSFKAYLMRADDENYMQDIVFHLNVDVQTD